MDAADKARTMQGLADHQTEAALLALVAARDRDPVLEFAAGLDEDDVRVLAVGLAQALVEEMTVRRQGELMISEEEAQRMVQEMARARAAWCAALYQQAEAEQ